MKGLWRLQDFGDVKAFGAFRIASLGFCQGDRVCGLV